MLGCPLPGPCPAQQRRDADLRGSGSSCQTAQDSPPPALTTACLYSQPPRPGTGQISHGPQSPLTCSCAAEDGRAAEEALRTDQRASLFLPPPPPAGPSGTPHGPANRSLVGKSGIQAKLGRGEARRKWVSGGEGWRPPGPLLGLRLTPVHWGEPHQVSALKLGVTAASPVFH